MTSMKGESSMRTLWCTKSSCCSTICAWQLPVRVVSPEGHIRSLARPVTVAELLRHHPHHFLCEPSSAGPHFHSAMLPPDMELQEGRVYLLLPLPRLLPHLSGASFQCCPCFQNPTSERRRTHRYFTRWFVRIQGHLVDTLRVPKVARSVVRLSRWALPERLRMRLSFHKLNSSSSSFASKGSEDDAKMSNAAQVQNLCTLRNRWRPELERISEVDLLMLRHDSSEVMIMR